MNIVEEKRDQKGFAKQKEIEEAYGSYLLEDRKIKKSRRTIENKTNFGEGGIPLLWNEEEERVAVDHTDAHSLVIGPTGSKKSRLVAMPLVKILGKAGESMIICDPKAEIYGRLADELEKQGYKINVLNLRDPDFSSCWNPLSIPYYFYCEGNENKSYEFINDIAVNLMGDSRHVKDSAFWDNSAASLFSGLVILLFRYCQEFEQLGDMVHMGNILWLRNCLLTKNVKERKERDRLWSYAKEDEIIKNALIGTVETANDTQAGILSTFDEKMRIFSMQPNIMDLMSKDDIFFESLTEQKTAVFLILPDEKTTYHRLVSLFIKQSYEYLIYLAQKGGTERGIRINYVLDEFSSLPTINDFPAMISAARSRNIRFNLFVQSKNQLLLRYEEEAETIQSNCTNWIFLYSREIKFLQEISELCGVRYVDNGKRPLLEVAELQQLSKDRGEVLILIGRYEPYLGRLLDIDYYEGKGYRIRPLPKRTGVSRARLKIQLPELSNMGMDIDRMLADIDKKIKELDEEETRTNQKQLERENQRKAMQEGEKMEELSKETMETAQEKMIERESLWNRAVDRLFTVGGNKE